MTQSECVVCFDTITCKESICTNCGAKKLPECEECEKKRIEKTNIDCMICRNKVQGIIQIVDWNIDDSDYETSNETGYETSYETDFETVDAEVVRMLLKKISILCINIFSIITIFIILLMYHYGYNYDSLEIPFLILCFLQVLRFAIGC